MEKSRFAEEQIPFALKQGDAGQSVADVCPQMGIIEATYCDCKQRFGNLGQLEVRELRQLRDGNALLKRLVPDLTLDRHVLSASAVQSGGPRGTRLEFQVLRKTDRRHFGIRHLVRRSSHAIDYLGLHHGTDCCP
jgi:putative transposase